jgi:splicing factor 3A subunit 1
VETIDFAVDEIVTMLPPPPPPPPPMPSQRGATTDSAVQPPTASRDPNDMQGSSDEDDDDGETIRVVPSYTPKVYAAHETNTMETVIDPITGKRVAVKDMPEHMRIQLLDPKWAQERKKFQDKQKESNLVSGDMVATNLERFAQARGDRFGKTVRCTLGMGLILMETKHGITNTLPLSLLQEQDLLSQEADSKKRLEEANRIIREQGQGSSSVFSTVGPTLPTTTATGIRKDAPIGPSDKMQAVASEEPAAKRAKVVTYAPAVLQQPLAPGMDFVAASAGPSTDLMELEDPFAAAATGAAAPQVSAAPSSFSSNPQQEMLIPEAEFAASLGGKTEITIQIRVPNDPSQMAWNFYGQIVSIAVNVMSQVKHVKEELSKAHLNGMPANKIQLKNPTTGTFLKDGVTLAALNIGPSSSTLELVPRARGGKKK